MVHRSSELQRHLQKYLDDSKNRTIPRLSQLSGIADKTIRRIVTGECEATLETALILLKHTSSNEEMRAIIKNDFSRYGAVIDHVFGKNDTYSVPPQNVQAYLATYTGCFIINIAAMNVGTTRNYIVKSLGTHGEQLLDEMLATGVLYEDNGIIRYCEKDFSCCNDTPALLTQAKHFADYIISNPKKSILSVQTESLNEEGIKRIQDVAIKYINEIGDIRQNPEYFGDKPFHFSTFIGLFPDINK